MEKFLMLGKIEGRRRRGCLGTQWFDGITDSMDTCLNRLWETAMGTDACSPWGHRVRHD